MKLVLPLVASIGWGVAGAAAVLPALFGVMAFDAPGSEENAWLWLFVGSMWAFPVACLVAICAVWVGFAVGSVRAQIAAAALPALPIVTGGVGIVWIQVMCGGNLSCG